MTLFQKANKVPRRLKMYIYGESGTGKTVTSLHFPSVACIDTEKGTDFYGEIFDFQRLTLAPIIVLSGLAFEIYAIMKNPSSKKG